jgi:hypothetical protein
MRDFRKIHSNLLSIAHVKYLNKKFHKESGFKVIKKRWIVERTFAWLPKRRPLERNMRKYRLKWSNGFVSSSRLILKLNILPFHLLLLFSHRLLDDLGN